MKKFWLVVTLGIYIPFGHSATDEIISAANYLAQNGYIVNHSFEIEKYNLESPILRQESVGIIMRIYGLTQQYENGYTCQNKFSDISEKDGWVCYVVEIAGEEGIVNSANEKFRPKDNMSHYEAMLLALNASCMGPVNSLSNENPQLQVLNFALDKGITDNSKIDMNTTVTRGQFFYYVDQAKKHITQHPEETVEWLPGCGKYKAVELNDLHVSIPEELCLKEKITEDGLINKYSIDGQFGSNYPFDGMFISLGMFSNEDKLNTNGYIDMTLLEFQNELNEFKFLKKYSWKGGKIIVYTLIEEGKENPSKGYTFIKVQDNSVYSVTGAYPVEKEKEHKTIMQNVLSSIKIQENGDIADGDIVTIHYTESQDDGTEYNSTYNKGRTPLEFVVGRGTLIEGLENAIRGMKVGQKKNLRLEPKDAYGEEFIEETIPLSEYNETFSQKVPANALLGKLEQSYSLEQATEFFGNTEVGTEKRVGDAILKIIAITDQDVSISIDDPKSPFYNKVLEVGMESTNGDGGKVTIKKIDGENVEIDVKPLQEIVSKTDTEITLRKKNIHPLAGEAANFDIELIRVKESGSNINHCSQEEIIESEQL